MDTSFETLNKILQTEHKAISRYQAYIDELTDGPLRNHLTSILTDHKNHATRISYYIQTNGGKAEEGAGLGGILEDWKTRWRNIRETVPREILQQLYDEEHKELVCVEGYAEKYLSSAEKEVLEPIFSAEREHLKQLNELREGYFSNI